MRSLILAGGGVKVAYQAGCLQVLLDEVQGDGPGGRGLRFDHVDAASGGCFNAAMMAHGMSGSEIANQWRAMNPRDLMSLNLAEYRKLIWARSIGTHAGTRRVIKDVWRLDFERIRRAASRRYTFNYYNFTDKRVVVVENQDVDEELLIACVSLLMWLPPIRRRDDFLFDAVWCTDGNVREAVRRGADEIWAIWTVTDTREMRDGFVSSYFHLIEAVANAHFKFEWAEIDAVNESIANHGRVRGPHQDFQLRPGFDRAAAVTSRPPPGRKVIKQHLIEQEVPVNYLLNRSRDRMAAAVEMGVLDARQYVRSLGMTVEPREPHIASQPSPVSITFSETMHGFFMPGAAQPEAGESEGRRAGNALAVRLTLSAGDLKAFLVEPKHRFAVEAGVVECPFLSASPMDVEYGTLDLLVNDREQHEEKSTPRKSPSPATNVPGHKRMRYELTFGDGRGTRYRLEGAKFVNDERGYRVWHDTTTLFVHLYRETRSSRELYGAGVIRITFPGFLTQLMTFRSSGGTGPAAGVAAIARFGLFFFGSLWDVYARLLLEYSPF